MENVLLLRQIVRAIESKSDRSVPEEFFHDVLDEQFSEEETLRQLETAINWGRYAELFDFDASRRRFIQSEKLHQDDTGGLYGGDRCMMRFPERLQQHSRTGDAGSLAGVAAQLAVCAGYVRCRDRAGLLLRRGRHCEVLVRASRAGDRHLAEPARACRCMRFIRLCGLGWRIC